MSQMQTTVGETDEFPLQKPKTVLVLGLLALTSLTFSYLGAYAVSGAMVNADMLRPWPAGADPRPKWLAIGFCTLLVSFLVVGGVARCMSRRQLQRIDEMADDAQGS